MRKIGISIYPKKETIEKDFEYLELAAKYGFTRLFTCLQSAEGSKEELVEIFTKVITKAHDLGFDVSVDASPTTFERFGASAMNIKPFNDMKIDIIRLDLSFGPLMDTVIVNNPYGIKVEFNGSLNCGVETLLENGAHRDRILICHNFYPQRYTGLDYEIFNELNIRWKRSYLHTAAFVSSNNSNTCGPWPVSAGLPTLEEHRDLPIELQTRYMIAYQLIDDILIGNAYATKEELELMGNVDLEKPTMRIDLVNDLSEEEKNILFNYPHSNRPDSTPYMLRSIMPRFVYKNKSIPARMVDVCEFKRGDVVIVNDNMAHYRGELQVVLKPMKNDGERNLVGTIKEEEIGMLNYIKSGNKFGFIK